jgi:hypothetical protein
VTGPIPSNAKHLGSTLATVSHWRLVLGPLTAEALTVLASVAADASTFYLRGGPGQTMPSALRTALEPLREWNSTSIPAGTGWPTDWSESFRLRAPGAALVHLREQGVPGTFGVAGLWLFRADELLAEWEQSDGVLRLAPALGEMRVRRLAKQLTQPLEWARAAV